MRRLRHDTVMFAVIFVLAHPLVGLRAASGETWMRVSQGPLSLYTQADAAEGEQLLSGFADLDYAMAGNCAFDVNTTANLRIIQFHSAKEFGRYRINPNATAFYQQTGRSEYIVIGSLQQREVSYHEFTHFLVAHSGLKVPLWLNEGLADFYSTFQVSGDQVVFGRSVAGRLPLLRTHAWIPLQNLFAVTTASTYYSQPDAMLLFYAESWALAHMLVASPEYGARFPQFLRTLQTHDTPESLRLTYNKTPGQIEEDLRSYLDAQHLPVIAAKFSRRVPLPDAGGTSSKISDAEMELTLADLNAANPEYRAGLETRLANVSSQLPERAEAEETLGYLALRQGRNEEARTHFERAVERRSTDGSVWFYLAHLRHEAGAPASETLPILRQALLLKADQPEARLELALVATEAGQYQEALAALDQLSQATAGQGIRPENGYVAAYAKAYSHAHLDQFSAARSAAKYAQTLAGNDGDRAEVAELLAYISENEAELK